MTKKAQTYWLKNLKPLLDECQAVGILEDYAEYSGQIVEFRLKVNPLIYLTDTQRYSFSISVLAEVEYTYKICRRILDEFKAFGLDDVKYKVLLLDLLTLNFKLHQVLGRWHIEDLSIMLNTPETLIYSNQWGYKELELNKPTLKVFEYIDDFKTAIARAETTRQLELEQQAKQDDLYARALTIFTRDELDELKEVL